LQISDPDDENGYVDREEPYHEYKERMAVIEERPRFDRIFDASLISHLLG
jgi:hypothetical protein